MVPAVWNAPIPPDDFWAVGVDGDLSDGGLECLPGVMPGGAPDTMVCVRNVTSEMMTIEGGTPLLRAVDTIEDMAPPLEGSDLGAMAKAFVKRSDYCEGSLRKALDQGRLMGKHIVFGLAREAPGGSLSCSKCTAERPWLVRYLLGLLDTTLPEIPCTSIEISWSADNPIENLGKSDGLR